MESVAFPSEIFDPTLDAAVFGADWDSVVNDLSFTNILQQPVEKTPVTFSFPDTTGYQYGASSPSLPMHNLGSNGMSSVTFELPIEKTAMKPNPLPSKEMELKMNSAQYDQHIQNYIAKYGPLPLKISEKVKDQRRRIRNRESANNSRKKKRNQQQTIREENKELRAENAELKEKLILLQRELDSWKKRFQDQKPQQIQSQQIRFQKQEKQEQTQQQCQGYQQLCTIRQIQERSDHPPLEDDQSQSLQYQPQLWRINNQPGNFRPLVLTSFIILFTFVLFIPHLQTTPPSFSQTNMQTNLTKDDFHGKKVTLNANSQSAEILPINTAFPSFYPANMIGGGGGGRALLMIDDLTMEPENSTIATDGNHDDSDEYEYNLVVDDSHSGFHLDRFDDLTYVLLIQSPTDIENGTHLPGTDYIDIVIPSQYDNSILHVTSKIIDQQLIPGSSTFFPSISEDVYAYSQ